MDFKKKLKKRLYINIFLLIIGIVMVIAANTVNNINPFMSPFGFGIVVCEIVRIRNYFIITKNEESIRKRQIAETDERNISIANKAKNVAFSVYVCLASVLVIVLQFINKPELSNIVAWSVCFLVFVYWVAYWIIRKKS